MTKKNMRDYIEESADVSISNIDNSKKLVSELVDLFIKEKPSKIWLVASGSSNNSAECAKPFMEKILGTDVKVVSSAQFVNYEYEKISTDDFVIVISQSGYSTNSIMALQKMKEQGLKSIGLTGNLNSDFNIYSDYIFDFGVGVETVGYVTKGVISLIVFLNLFALESALTLNEILEKDYQKLKSEMVDILQKNDQTIMNTDKWIEENYKLLTSIDTLYVCAIGSNLGTAKEAALKIGETVHIPSISYEIEEFIHGPNLQLSPNYTIFLLDSGDLTHDRTMEIFEGCKAITNRAFLITNKKIYGDDIVNVYNTSSETLNPLAYLPVFQVVASTISKELRIQDHPLLQKFKEITKAKSENYKS